MAESNINFISSTLMGRQQNKKVLQLIQSLMDSSDSVEFREPVDWKAYGLLDYPMVIKKPMDLSTVKKNLANNLYESVEDALRDIDLIWTNCRTYNKDNAYYQKLSQKLDKTTKKMIKNYLPFVIFEIAQKKKAAQLKKEALKKAPVQKPAVQQPKTYQDMKENKIEEEPKEEDTPFLKMRKELLFFIPLCTPDQVGVVFMLINKNEPEAIEYTDDGEVKIIAEKLSDKMVKRLTDQLDMWGIGYVSGKKKGTPKMTYE